MSLPSDDLTTATNEDLLRQIEQLKGENNQLKGENKQLIGENKHLEGEKEDAQRLLQNTTLEEYLRACQEQVLSKVVLLTDGYLTSRAPIKDPSRKHCPYLKPWTDFIATQRDMLQKIDRTVPYNARLFENITSLDTIGNRVHGRRVSSESGLIFVQNNCVEDPVRIILSHLKDFQPERQGLDIPDEVFFQTTANSLRDPTDKRETVERDARLRTDQICVFRNSAEDKDIAFVIEYKAPHKLHTSHFEKGLREMSIVDEVVNKLTIPTIEPDKFQHYAELLSAAAITQTYHYMLEAGLEYGYVTNGDGIVFLKIDWTRPTEVLYHLAQPLREVVVNDEPEYSNAVCQVLAFTVLALPAQQHTNDERVAAARNCPKWEVDFGWILDKIALEEKKEEEKRDPKTPASK